MLEREPAGGGIAVHRRGGGLAAFVGHARAARVESTAIGHRIETRHGAGDLVQAILAA